MLSSLDMIEYIVCPATLSALPSAAFCASLCAKWPAIKRCQYALSACINTTKALHVSSQGRQYNGIQLSTDLMELDFSTSSSQGSPLRTPIFFWGSAYLQEQHTGQCGVCKRSRNRVLASKSLELHGWKHFFVIQRALCITVTWGGG